MKFGKKAKLAALSALTVAPVSAMAALPADVVTELNNAKADIIEAAGIIIIIAAVVAGTFWLRRVVK